MPIDIPPNTIDYIAPLSPPKEMYNGVPRKEIEEQWINVELASRRLASRLRQTLLRRGNPIIERAPNFKGTIYYKCDHLRATGSFKERGALNALLSLSPEEAKAGVAAASAGNHSQALAFHGQKLSIPIMVVMPLNAPVMKVENCRLLGAEVVLHGGSFSEAMTKAYKLAKQRGMTYINGYNHPDIIAGAGTCGLEIIAQIPDVDAIVVPCGGGGLLAGVALAVKRVKPNVKIIGVESIRCPSMCRALAAGRPVPTDIMGGTIADGLAVSSVGANCHRMVDRYVDEMIAIPEHYISIAILHLLEKEKMLCEGAGCAGLAGIFSGKLDKTLKGCSKVVTILCGGNIDMTKLGRVLERGMHSTGRLMKFDCAISDRCGGLSKFCRRLADTRASIKEIVHDRPFVTDLDVCSVHITVEVLSNNHWLEIVAYMAKHGFVLKGANDQKYNDVNLTRLYSTSDLTPVNSLENAANIKSKL